jgi:hypothetical protein
MESGFEGFMGEFENSAAPQLRSAFRWALVASVWIAPLLIRRMPPIGRLVPSDRAAALLAMERSSVVALRQLVRVLKTVVALHYGALPEVRQAIQYHA